MVLIVCFFVLTRGCHKDAQPFFLYYGTHSLMFTSPQILT